jgi:hypothetical protein
MDLLPLCLDIHPARILVNADARSALHALAQSSRRTVVRKQPYVRRNQYNIMINTRFGNAASKCAAGIIV